PGLVHPGQCGQTAGRGAVDARESAARSAAAGHGRQGLVDGSAAHVPKVMYDVVQVLPRERVEREGCAIRTLRGAVPRVHRNSLEPGSGYLRRLREFGGDGRGILIVVPVSNGGFVLISVDESRVVLDQEPSEPLGI